MKTYSDLKKGTKNFDYSNLYAIAQADNKGDKKVLRNTLRNVFEDNEKISEDLLKDLKKANFFTENKSVFSEKYDLFFKENTVLFK